MAAKLDKVVKRVETLIKAYKFDDKNWINVLRFLAQFKRACNFNRVSKGMDYWVMPNIMKDGPASILTVRMTPSGDALGE